MKSKHWIGIVMALTLCVGVFFTPVTAFAATEKDTTPPELSAELSGETLAVSAIDDISGVQGIYVDGKRISTLVNGGASVALKDYHGNQKDVSVHAMDYAGNKSAAKTFPNPLYDPASTPAPTPSTSSSSQPVPIPVASSSSQAPPVSSSSSSSPAASSSAPVSSSSQGAASSSSQAPSSGSNTSAVPTPGDAFTPDGQGEVQDNATEDSKDFYTITTEAGYTYYLVIDHARDSDNVYFLNAVTEADLLGLAENGTAPGQSAIPDTSEPEPVDTSEPDSPSEPADTNNGSGGGFGTIIFVLLIVAAVGGAGWYFKIYKPKQQAALDDEEDFDEEGGEDWDDGDDILSDDYDFDAEEAYQTESDVEIENEEANILEQ